MTVTVDEEAATAAALAPDAGRPVAILAMVASAACWGLATVMTKGALEALPPFTLLAIQLTASVAFLWTALLLRGGPPALGRRHVSVALTGLLEPGLAYAAAVPGIALGSAAHATVIGATEPALVCALAFLLGRDAPAPRLLAAILVAMTGVVLMSVAGSGAAPSAAGDALAGDALVLLGTLFAASYVILTSRHTHVLAPLPLATVQQSAGLGFVLAFAGTALALGWETLPERLPADMLLLAIVSGIVQYALAFWLYLVGLRRLGATTSELFLTLIPVFGVGGAITLLGERLTPLHWFGCGLVLVAVGTILRRH